jgi:hypothetical protein
VATDVEPRGVEPLISSLFARPWRCQPLFGPLVSPSQARTIRELVVGMLLIPTLGQLGPFRGLPRLGVLVDEPEHGQAFGTKRTIIPSAASCYLLLLSIALCQRIFRPRAKAAYSSRSRCCRSRSRVCLGDTRYDKNRIRSDPPLAECTVLYHASLPQYIALKTIYSQHLVFWSRLWIISAPAGPLHHSPLDSHIWL